MFHSPLRHRLKHTAGISGGEFKQGSGQRLKPGKLIQELHSKMVLRLGVDERSAPIDGKESEELNPSGASLPVVVDDRLDPDAIPEDAHHNQG